jgi:hypothetical protein
MVGLLLFSLAWLVTFVVNASDRTCRLSLISIAWNLLVGFAFIWPASVCPPAGVALRLPSTRSQSREDTCEPSHGSV